MSKGWMYILECGNGAYYTGSTNDLELRLEQHQNGEGANFTKKHLPVKLVYFEEYDRIDEAFYREKQVQGWSRKKKEALIKGEYGKLPELSKNYTQFGKPGTLPLRQAQGAEATPLVEPVETSEGTSTLPLRQAQGTDTTPLVELSHFDKAQCAGSQLAEPVEATDNKKKES